VRSVAASSQESLHRAGYLSPPKDIQACVNQGGLARDDSIRVTTVFGAATAGPAPLHQNQPGVTSWLDIVDFLHFAEAVGISVWLFNSIPTRPSRAETG
jgi:hypothetical protein